MMNDALFSKPSKDYIRKYGAVFTPTKWAYKIVFDNCYKKWIDGATVLDPTAGDGVFIKAFLEIANNEGITITNEMISRLYGIELNPYYVEAFYRSVKDTFDIEFPRDNFIQGDIFFIERDIKADILVGNPPWVNFTDLDEYYKERIKHLFLYWGLVKNPQDLLLGNARTDIAALVLLKVIHSNLKDNGSAIFFALCQYSRMMAQTKNLETIILGVLIFALRRFLISMVRKYSMTFLEDMALHFQKK